MNCKKDICGKANIDAFECLGYDLELDLKKNLEECSLYLANWCGFQSAYILEYINLEIITNKDFHTKNYVIGIGNKAINHQSTKVLVDQDFALMSCQEQREHITKIIIFGFVDIYILKNSNLVFLKLLAEHKLMDHHIDEKDVDIDQKLMDFLVESLLIDVYKKNDDKNFKKSFFFYDILSQTIPTRLYAKSM